MLYEVITQFPLIQECLNLMVAAIPISDVLDYPVSGYWIFRATFFYKEYKRCKENRNNFV